MPLPLAMLSSVVSERAKLTVRVRTFLAALVLVAGLAAAPARAAVPQGFVGMNGGPTFYPGVSLPGQLDSMVASGVESVRALVSWHDFQPYKSFSNVPPGQRSLFQNVGGVPTSFTVFDSYVAAAAARGVTLLPVVTYAAPWDARHPGQKSSPPSSATPYANFVAALVHRYGPRGTFWSQNPGIHKVPIRMWQIWNEPDLTSYWSDQPWAPGYVHLLASTYKAIKKADSHALVVLAGLPNFSWLDLEKIYKVKGARKVFDAVAVHPYTLNPAGVITILKKVRAVMNHNHDSRKPMLATEISWPSSLGKAPQQFDIGTTEQGQADKTKAVLPLLARYRSSLHLLAFYYYVWMADESPGANGYQFNFAGLLKYISGHVIAKPALSVFRAGVLSIEGCASKGSLATSCL